MIRAVGVIVPAHNEQQLLPACLASLRRAAQALPDMPLHLIVAADACRDLTARAARRGGATVVTISARSAGAARAAGAREILRRTRRLDPADVWLATTDADSVVPRCWLRQQVGYADQGWDAVAGTVRVADWSGYQSRTRATFSERYDPPGDTRAAPALPHAAQVPHLPDPSGQVSSSHIAVLPHVPGDTQGTGPPLLPVGSAQPLHPHVHGANLGFRASAYLLAGGFPDLATAEDHAIVAALTAQGARVLRTRALPVVTSARREARAPRGFAHYLAQLDQATA